MQLFRTEMIRFHPPQRPLAHRLRGGRLRYGCRLARPRLAPPEAPAEAARFLAPEAIVVDLGETPAMERAA